MPNKPIPYNKAKEEYESWKVRNPEYYAQNKTDINTWARSMKHKTGSDIYDRALDASPLRKLASAIDAPFKKGAAKVGTAVRGEGVAEHPNPWVETLARGGEQLVGSTPSLGVTLASNTLPGKVTKRVLAPALAATYGYNSGMAETDDVTSSLVNAASLAASPYLSAKGAKIGKDLLPDSPKIGQALGGMAGGFLGDASEVLSSPTGDPDAGLLDRAATNIDWFKDPRNLGSLAIAEAPLAGVGKIVEMADARVKKRADTVAKQRGLFSATGKAVDLKKSLENEYLLDVPEGSNDEPIRMAAEDIRANPNKEEGSRLAQIRLYRGSLDNLTDAQQAKLSDLESSADLKSDYAKNLDRDLESESGYLDELAFTFKDPEAMSDVTRNLGLTPENSRVVGNTLFYRGSDATTKTWLNKAARRGEASMFSQEGVDTSLDAEYRKAVESGDLKRARKMVKDRAKEKGYDTKGYHGTDEDFNEFDSETFGESTGSGDLGDAFYAAGDKDMAAHFGDRVKELYLKTGHKAKNKVLNTDEMLDILADDYFSDVGAELKKLGYDSAEYTHKDGSVEYALYEANRLKSADVVTYDNQGNLIPLSRRFDDTTDDIRYSQERDLNFEEASDVIRQTPGEQTGTREFVEKVRQDTKEGSTMDIDVATRVLEKIIGKGKLLETINKSLRNKGNKVKGYQIDDRAVVNLNETTARKAISTGAHEGTHVNLRKLALTDPEAYAKLVDDVADMDVDVAKSLFSELNELVPGLDIDVDFASGKNIDPANREVVAEERLAAIAEALVSAELSTKPGVVSDLLNFLPMSVQRFIRDSFNAIKSWFTSDTRLGSLLSDQTKGDFDKLYESLDKAILKNEKLMGKLSNIASNMDQFSPEKKGVGLTTPFHVRKDAMYSQTSQLNDDVTVVETENLSGAKKNLWSMLALSRVYPQARVLASALHNYRPNIQKKLMSYWNNLGQDAKGTLSESEAIEQFESWTRGVAKEPGRLAKMGKVFKADQAARSNDKPLTSIEEMKSKYNLSEQDASMVKKLRELTSKVAYQEFLDMSHRDYLNLASYLSVNYGSVLKKDSAERIARSVTQMGTEIAKAQNKVNVAEGKLEARKEEGLEANAEAVALLEAIQMLSLSQDKAFQMLASQLNSEGLVVDGADPRLRAAIKLAGLQGDYRIKHMQQTQKAGYAPMTRREKFLVRYTDANGEYALTDYRTKKEAMAGIDKLRKAGGKEFNLSEKTDAEFYRHYTSSTLQAIRDQYKMELGKLIEQTEGLSPEAKAELEAVEQNFGDMDKELANALGQKADPFKLKRNDVGGFREHQFVPNLLDYIQVKTTIGEKGIIQARAKFEMAQPEFFKNKDLLERFSEITNYTLNSNQAEYTPLRKFIFLHYLGGSIRHLVQNITQPTIVGIPHLTSETGNPLQAMKQTAKAYKDVTNWNTKGTTGNANLDRVFKQAEDEHVWDPSIQDSYTGTGEIRTGANTAKLYQDGKTGFLQRAKINAKIAGTEMENYLKLTGESSEKLNRQIGFAMRVNGEVKGNKTTEQLSEIFNDGVRFTNDINFVGDKSNRPGFIQRSTTGHGPLLTLLALQSFTINQMSLLASYAHQFRKGTIDPKTYKNRGDAFKLENPGLHGFLMSGITLTAFGGLLALPFAGVVDEMVEEYTGHRLSSWVKHKAIDISSLFGLGEEYGSLFADSLVDGFVTSGSGVGIGRSVGLGNPVGIQTGQPFSFWDFAGAGGSIAEKYISGVSSIAKSPLDKATWMKGIDTMSPAAVKYWTNLKDLSDDNVERDNRGKVVSNPLDKGAGLSRVLGITPHVATKDRATEFEIKRKRERLFKKRQKLVDDVSWYLYRYQKYGGEKNRLKAVKLYSSYLKSNEHTDLDKTSLLRSINNAILKQSGYTIDRPDLATRELITQAQKSNPGYSPGVTGKVRERLGQISTAKALGDLESVQKLSKVSPRTQSKYVIYDKLVKQGMDRNLAWALVNRNESRVRALQAQDGVPVLRDAR